jgi:hypothetical protein
MFENFINPLGEKYVKKLGDLKSKYELEKDKLWRSFAKSQYGAFQSVDILDKYNLVLNMRICLVNREILNAFDFDGTVRDKRYKLAYNLRKSFEENEIIPIYLDMIGYPETKYTSKTEFSEVMGKIEINFNI